MQNKIKKMDIILIAIYLSSSVILAIYFAFGGLNIQTDNKQVVIYVESKLYEKVSLPTSNKKLINIKTSNGFNTVVIDGDRVYMHDSDCHDKICIKQGEIFKAGEMIVCLPNKILVEIQGVNELEVDSIAK